MDDHDEDRTAILRRRQRLIALALTGLTSAAGCDEPAHDSVETPPVVETEDRVEVDAPEEAAPVPTVTGEAPPYEPDPGEVRHAEDAKRRWRAREAAQAAPRPCLSRIRPQVCLSPIVPRKPGDTEE